MKKLIKYTNKLLKEIKRLNKIIHCRNITISNSEYKIRRLQAVNNSRKEIIERLDEMPEMPEGDNDFKDLERSLYADKE